LITAIVPLILTIEESLLVYVIIPLLLLDGNGKAKAGSVVTFEIFAILPIVGFNGVVLPYTKPVAVAVPPGVITEIVPVVPKPTTAVIVVLLTTVKDVAGVPPKDTEMALLKLVPVTVTVVALFVLVGVKLVMVGAGTNVNPAKVAVPAGVVTLTTPVAPVATVAVICVGLSTTKEVAATPPKLTTVALLNAFPVITTLPLFPTLTGVNELITGTAFESINKVLLSGPVYLLNVTELPFLVIEPTD
jgi:hypothetical protein